MGKELFRNRTGGRGARSPRDGVQEGVKRRGERHDVVAVHRDERGPDDGGFNRPDLPQSGAVFQWDVKIDPRHPRGNEQKHQLSGPEHHGLGVVGERTIQWDYDPLGINAPEGDSADVPDWEKADAPMVEAIVDAGEAYLQGQLAIATSADQRAAVLGGIFAASGTAIIAAIIAASDTTSGAVLAAGFVAGVFFLVGAALCLWTVLPVSFHVAGTEPENWYGDVRAGTPLNRALGDVAEDIQRRIEVNNRTLSRNASVFRAGSIVGLLSPVVGSLVLVAAQFCG